MSTGNFTPARWLTNPHLQTLWASTCRPTIPLETRRERIELPDGDFVDLDWGTRQQGPIAIVFHGLEGSSRSGYVRGIMSALQEKGWQAVVMNFRGCSGEPNRLSRSYHSGDTGDIEYIVRLLKAKYPSTPVAAIGYSLGGNALLKWLGETGTKNRLDAAVAISVPFDLDCAATTLRDSAWGIYQNHLLKRLKRTVNAKRHLLDGAIDLGKAFSAKDFHAFDDAVTAPLHGFNDVHDYYAKSSSRQYIPGIATPTLILHAADDPFMSQKSIPSNHELPVPVQLEVSEHGGHVGFIDPHGYWLEQRIPGFLETFKYFHPNENQVR